MENVIEGNKLIAEFLGWKPDKIGDMEIFRDSHDSPQLVDGLTFHESWSDLMPVVEKIHSIGTHVITITRTESNIWDIQEDDAYGSSLNTVIESTYDVVLHFITYYNTLTDKTKNNDK